LPQEISQQIEAIVDSLRRSVEEKMPKWKEARDPVAVRTMEQEIAELHRQAADQITALTLQQLVDTPELQVNASVAARQQLGYRSGGTRSVKVEMLGGGTVTLRVEYLKPDNRKSKTRRKKSKL
jgi:hypothetical protein